MTEISIDESTHRRAVSAALELLEMCRQCNSTNVIDPANISDTSPETVVLGLVALLEAAFTGIFGSYEGGAALTREALKFALARGPLQ